EMRLEFYDDDLVVAFESRVGLPGDGWLRLCYSIANYWTGAAIEINDTIRLEATRPNFGGRRWWFRCPRTNRRVRNVHLPLGARHCWSRRAYRLGYASQREGRHDRALRSVRKLYNRLGADPADGEYPARPKRMRQVTYARLVAELDAARRVADRA